MAAARRLDELEARYVSNGEAFFHVSGAGHEASCVLASFLNESDWLHLHYRDKAFMLARGLAPEQFFHSLFCNAESHSAGRQMSAHLSDPALKLLSLVGPVGNNALQAVGVAAEIKAQPERPLVVCANGDGTTQQGEVLEAIAEAVRETLPVLFFVHDNALAISTDTRGKTFYDLPDGAPDVYYGLPIHRIDGRSPQDCAAVLEQVVSAMRQDRKPAIVVMAAERLTSHTNADDETVYRSDETREHAKRTGDPILNFVEHLKAQGHDEKQLTDTVAKAKAWVEAAADTACQGTIPATPQVRSTCLLYTSPSPRDA